MSGCEPRLYEVCSPAVGRVFAAGTYSAGCDCVLRLLLTPQRTQAPFWDVWWSNCSYLRLTDFVCHVQTPLNLERLMKWIRDGRLDMTKVPSLLLSSLELIDTQVYEP